MQNLDSSLSRRNLLRRAGLIGAGAALAPLAATGTALAQKPNLDNDILDFALNLEYLEAEYYLRGVTGQGISNQVAGRGAGTVTGGRRVVFETPAIGQFAQELAANEFAHVLLYRRTLGPRANSRPEINFTAGFQALATAAGLPGNFDPFADEISFLIGGWIFEDVGVTAYRGAAPLITDKKLLATAAGVLSVESYHMGMVRSLLYKAGAAVHDITTRISNARDTVDGGTDKDQPIAESGRANIVPTDDNGLVFARSTQEVLKIVYLTPAENATRGGFFPSGVPGTFNMT